MGGLDGGWLPPGGSKCPAFFPRLLPALAESRAPWSHVPKTSPDPRPLGRPLPLLWERRYVRPRGVRGGRSRGTLSKDWNILGWCGSSHACCMPLVGGGYHPIAQMGHLRDREDVSCPEVTRGSGLHSLESDGGGGAGGGRGEGEREVLTPCIRFVCFETKHRGHGKISPCHLGPRRGLLNLSFPIWKMGP